MFDTASLAIFTLAALALLLMPGPAVLYIVARSIEQGRLAGIVSTLGIALGSTSHVVFAALGLSALLQIVILGVIFVSMAIVSDSTYALVAGTAGQLLSGNVQLARAQKYLAGTIYISLGVTTALFGSSGDN